MARFWPICIPAGIFAALPEPARSRRFDFAEGPDEAVLILVPHLKGDVGNFQAAILQKPAGFINSQVGEVVIYR
ncbi:hypothetical protein D3C84_1036020 [compost metagenome]